MMRKYFLLAAFLFSLINYAEGQTKFQKSYNYQKRDEPKAIRITSDNGYIIVGRSQDSTIIGTLIKTDATGSMTWQKHYTTTFWDYMNCVDRTIEGGYLMAGRDANLNPYVIKTDASGNLLWSKSYFVGYITAFIDLQARGDGTYLLLTADANPYVIKINSLGDTLWTQRLIISPLSIINDIQLTTDGGCILIGAFKAFSQDPDILMIKMDSSGTPEWNRTFNTGTKETGISIGQTSDGGYVLYCDLSDSATISGSTQVIKTDINGNLQWSRKYTISMFDHAESIKQTFDGGYILAGTTNSFAAIEEIGFLIRTNNQGTIQWSKKYYNGDSCTFITVLQTSDSGFIVTGYSRVNSDNDFYLVKTDKNGSSGCNDSSITPVVTVLSPIVSSVTITTSSGLTILNPVTLVDTGGTQSTTCAIIGIDDYSSSQIFQIYPNPSPNSFTIHQSLPTVNSHLSIYNCLGSEVYQTTLTSPEQTITTNLSSGIYFVRVVNEDGGSVVEKIVIE
jgi:hypothetical protein